MNLLVTGAWREASECMELLKTHHDVVFMQWENKKLPCEYDWVEGIIGNGIFLSHPIEKFVNLKYIQLTSAGYDRVPMNYVKEHNIEIHNAKGVYSIPMAEFAIAGVLQLYKRSRKFWHNQEKHCWEKQQGLQELNGKNVCIVGCGDVGKECAKRFKAFGCRVIGVNRTVRDDSLFEKVCGLDGLEKAVENADILIITIALTENTKYLINQKILRRIKNTAVLVNVARGEVIKTKALIDRMPYIGGAVIDVFEEEPLSSGNELWEMENVILTPHNSFAGDGNSDRMRKVILKNLEKE